MSIWYNNNKILISVNVVSCTYLFGMAYTHTHVHVKQLVFNPVKAAEAKAKKQK